MTEPATQPMRVLFLCTHNSSRSQMAEGLLRARGGAAFDVFSAGTEPRVVHPLAIKAMREIGIDQCASASALGVPNPSRVEGSEEERLAAFRHIRDLIATRIRQFLQL